MTGFRLTLALVGVAAFGCECDDGGLIDARARLVIEPAQVDFGKIPVGAQRIRGLKLANRGQAPLEISRFELATSSGELVFASPIPTRLLPEQTIDFNLVYEPTDVGEDTGTITIVADDGEDARTVPVTGEGVEAGVAVETSGDACGTTPDSVSFGRVVPGDFVERTFAVRAAGTANVTILSVVRDPATSAEFEVDPVSEQVLAPGEALTVTARYRPVDGGADSGAIVVTTDAAASGSLRVAVCGESVAPAICARPVPLDLGAAASGQTVSGTMTLESCGLQPLQLMGVRLSSDAQHPTNAGFSMTSAPMTPVTLAPGATVEVAIDFTPGALGAADGFIEVMSDALERTVAYFPIRARGAMPCDLFVGPDPVQFVGVAAGATQQQQIVLVNNGASACNLSRIEVTTGAATFRAVSPTAPTIVAPGASVSGVVEYAPTASGMPDMGTLEVEEGGVTRSITLLGNPDLAGGCFVQVTPPALNFGAVQAGAPRSLGAEILNVGQDPCFLRSVDLGPGTSSDFIETSPSFGIIAPGRTKQVTVTYTPTSGSATGTLVIEVSDGITGPRTSITVPLFGSAGTTGICVMPRTVDFGNTMTVADRTFGIFACGGRAVTVTALDFTVVDPEFSIQMMPTLPFTLAAGASQTINVRYQPTDNMGDTGEITVRSSDPVDPAIGVTLTGGRELVPPTAGRFLYYWQISNAFSSDVMRLPLQGNTTAQPWWGSRTGKACSGCHSVSPDGRYVAVIEGPGFRMVDTTTNLALSVPNNAISPAYVSWRPDINTNPPYQYAYDDGGNISIAALFVGTLRQLQGAADPNLPELMPSWGSNGQIAFVRGTTTAGGQGGTSFGFQGPTDILVVSENGGTASLLMGASGGGAASYYPRHSPNGLWIAFTYSAQASTTIAAGDAVLRLARADNSGTVVNLPAINSAPGDGASSFPTWAVDGSHLSFSSNRAGGRGDWDLYVAPIDQVTGVGGAPTNLTDANTSAFEHSAQWSP